MLAFNNHTNQAAVLIKYLKLSGINIDPQNIVEELEKHPDSPSILAISDVLNWFQIPNAAYRVGADKLADVPLPFIAHTKNNNDFVTVSRITNDVVILSDHKKNNLRLPVAKFNSLYNGVVLTGDAAQNQEYDIKGWMERLSAYKMPAAMLALSLIFLSVVLFNGFAASITWQLIALTLLKTAGLMTSVLLLVQSIDKNNPLIQTLCGGGGKTNCNAILTSKAANVFNGLTWSEVGFFYFAGSWLALLFAGSRPGMLPVLATMNIIGLPYTIYSIDHQARVAKQWCVLCTTVQALLWLEFMAFLPSLFYIGKMGEVLVKSAPILSAYLITPIAIWLLIKPLLLKDQQLKALKGQLQKFKYNRDLFESSLKENPKYALPADEWSIVLGNVEAPVEITMVSNPYCSPCRVAHQELEKWLDKLNDVRLRIVFAVKSEEVDKKAIIVKHLMALNETNNRSLIKQALTDWYGQKYNGYENWAKAYPVDIDENKFYKLDRQKEWCDMAQVEYTPTILVNGYRLPELYRAQDIKYMLK